MKKEPLGNSATTRAANVANARTFDSIKERHRGKIRGQKSGWRESWTHYENHVTTDSKNGIQESV